MQVSARDGIIVETAPIVSKFKGQLDIYNKAKESGLNVHMITDEGLTEFNGISTNTCLAIGPDLASRIDPITKDLKCL